MNRNRLMACCLIVVGAAAPLLAAGDAAKGKEVFATSCANCHNADSNEKKIGPGLKGLLKKDKLADGKKASEANIRTKLDEGGNGMPAYKDMLKATEKDNLIAYLKTL
jgi:cytochrome c